ncbi:MAG: peptidylprolyl isomerase [Pirellulaceae bacterium]
MFHRLLTAAGFLSVVVALTCAAAAQTEPPQPATAPPAAAPPPADPNKPAAAEFAKLFEEWKSLLNSLRQVKLKFDSAPADEVPKINEEWNALIAQGNDMLLRLQAAGIKAYEESPNEDPQLTRFLVKLAADSAARDEYESTLAVADALIANKCDDKSIYGPASLAAFATNEYDKSIEYNKLATQAGQPSQVLADVDLEEYKTLWEKEAAIRAKEAEKNDLPRVKFTTTKGEIVLELLEDQAPDTVGNFVSLVEDKFYDGLTFHRVLPNFMAQGGCPKGDGTGGPGYQIRCECYEEDRRDHFRGSLSMAHSGRDTGGSQFFLTFLPTPHLNGRHTAFGRVVEGMDVLAKLQRIDPMSPDGKTPDKIITAQVVRKRDHAYAPNKVQ